MPDGITQCYLAAEPATWFSDPGGMQGWVCLVWHCQSMKRRCAGNIKAMMIGGKDYPNCCIYFEYGTCTQNVCTYMNSSSFCYCGIFAAMPVSVLSNLGNGMFVVFKQKTRHIYILLWCDGVVLVGSKPNLDEHLHPSVLWHCQMGLIPVKLLLTVKRLAVKTISKWPVMCQVGR